MTSTTHRAELERTIASDPELADPVHAATVKLARDLADQIDSELAATRTAQSRLIASYSAVLNALRRVVKDARDRRRREGGRAPREAGRLAMIQAHASAALGAAEPDD